MIKDLITKNRSYRRFDNSHSISEDTLIKLIDLARLSGSASNRQVLRFYISNTNSKNNDIFTCIKWAGYLTDWQHPIPEERPSAYIVILKPEDTASYIGHDTGIACQSILLGAVEAGLGGCLFGSVDRIKLKELLKIPSQYEIELVIAIGKPVEKIQLDPVQNNDIKYWRDQNQIHHVPKRDINDLIIK